MKPVVLRADRVEVGDLIQISNNLFGLSAAGGPRARGQKGERMIVKASVWSGACRGLVVHVEHVACRITPRTPLLYDFDSEHVAGMVLSSFVSDGHACVVVRLDVDGLSEIPTYIVPQFGIAQEGIEGDGLPLSVDRVIALAVTQSPGDRTLRPIAPYIAERIE